MGQRLESFPKENKLSVKKTHRGDKDLHPEGGGE